MKSCYPTLISLSLIFSLSAACAALSKNDSRKIASEDAQKSDYSNMKDRFLFSIDSKGNKPNPLSPLLVGPDFPFNPTNPDNKVYLSPSNWGYYPGSGNLIEDMKTIVPEIVSHIATEGTTKSDVFLSALLARSGASIYLPMRLEKETWYGGVEDLSEYKIFDVAKLNYRNITPPKNTFQQYEITTEGLGSVSNGFGSVAVRDVYKWLHPAISPSGKLGARMVWALDTKAKTLHDAVVIWDLRTGEIQRLIKLPVNFFMATYKNVTAKCPEADNQYLDAACKYSRNGQALSVKPSTPFFVSESEVMLPLVYLTNSQSSVIVDSMRFLFQRLDLTKAEQSWDMTAEGDKIRILTDAIFLYAQVDQSQNTETVSVPQLSTKDIERAFSYFSVAHRFSNPNGQLGFPVFSATTLARSVVSMLSDFKGINDGLPFVNPNPLPKDSEGVLGTKMLITGTGDFGYAYTGKNRKSGIFRRFFSVDGKAEIPTPQMIAGFSDSLPSFFPSIYQPSFAYKERYTDQETYKYAASLDDLNSFSGTELIAIWEDASLPKGHYFAKLSTRSKLYDSYNDLKGANKTRIDRVENIDLNSKPKNDSGNFWRYATLAVVKFQPKNLWRSTGLEKCQAITELNLEICNQIMYLLKKPGKLFSGNFYLKTGEKLPLKEVDVETKAPPEQGCWYKTCQYSEIRKLSADIPGQSGATLSVTKVGSATCTYTAAGRSCGPMTYVVSGSVKKRKPGVDENEPEDKKYDTYELNIFWDGKADEYMN